MGLRIRMKKCASMHELFVWLVDRSVSSPFLLPVQSEKQRRSSRWRKFRGAFLSLLVVVMSSDRPPSLFVSTSLEFARECVVRADV